MAKKADPNHILALRFSALGDVAMTVPVLLALTEKYPNLKITVVSRGSHKALFEKVPSVAFFEAKLKKEHKGILGLWKLYRELKKLRPGAVADFHNVLRSNVLKTFFVLGGIRVVQIDKGRAERRALVRPKNKNFQKLKATHERYAEVFAKLGFPVQVNKKQTLNRADLERIVLNLSGTKTNKWIGIAPFAAHSGKMYPLDKMGNVITSLKNTKKYKIFLFGGGEHEINALEAMADNSKGVVNMAGKLTFAEELQLISNLDLMVAMDSANGHLAANYGIPVVTLWGVTHPHTGFAPFEQPLEHMIFSDRKKYPLIPTSVYGNKVPKGYENVMQSISVESVLAKIDFVLAK